MPGAEARELLGEDRFQAQTSPFGRHFEHAVAARDFDRLHQFLYLDTKTYLPATNLFYSDKTSMAHSVELRVPYLDLEIVKLMQRVPSKYKVGTHGYKPLLKAVAKKYLPLDIVRRRKTGFGLPLDDWMREDLQLMARDLLARTSDLFDQAVITRWLDEHRAKKANHGMKLYSLMSFQLWREAFSVDASN